MTIIAQHGLLAAEGGAWTPSPKLVAWWYAKTNVAPLGTLADQIGIYDMTGLGDAYATAGTGAIFDGTGDAYGAGDVLDSVFAGSNAQFTVGAFLFQSSLPAGDQIIIGKFASSGVSENQRQFFVSSLDAGKVRFVWYGALNGASYRVYKTANVHLAADTWTHIAVTYDGTRTLENRVVIYINGTAAALDADPGSPGTPSAIPDGTAPVAIGAQVNSAMTAVATGIVGIIDDAWIADGIMTQGEIQDHIANSPGRHSA